MERRVTVRMEHRRKTFFLLFLQSCREASDDSHQKFVYYKAIGGIKQYPLEVHNICDLKSISGIGDTIAARCEAAWETICSDLQSDLSLKDVKALKKEDFERLVLGGKNVKKKPTPKKKPPSKTGSDEFNEPPRKKAARMGRSTSTMIVAPQKAPVLPRSSSTREFVDSVDDIIVETVSKAIPKRPPAMAVNSREFVESDDDCTAIEPTSKNKDNHTARSLNLQQPTTSSNTFTRTTSDTCTPSTNEVQYIVCHPRDQAEVILICDTREDRKKRRRSNVVEVLFKKGTSRMETRQLAVGDFLWIARKIDGSEMVLDWVVERKTWDDLDSSIRKGRYTEQKQRLCRAPIANRVYLLEDRGRGEVAAEQALATTRTRDGFMIQRCESGHETAKFLESVTRRLQTKIRTQQMSGIRFDDLQTISQKGQVGTVKNVWVEQLTVCPGMSSTRAQSVAESFPSIKSLADFYRSNKNGDQSDLLHKAVPQVPKPVSVRMSKFFVR